MQIEKAEVGRKVVYTPYNNCHSGQKEEGIITSFNDSYVFVRYGSDIGSKATNPNDIKYI